jgi:hypothetical protein
MPKCQKSWVLSHSGKHSNYLPLDIIEFEIYNHAQTNMWLMQMDGFYGADHLETMTFVQKIRKNKKKS